MQSMKESAANIAASAKAGMDKTKATVQEKVEKMTAHDPMEKEIATERKEQRKAEAEINKQEARSHNAAAKHTNAAGGTGHNPAGYTADSFSHSVTGEHGRSTGTHQMSALPGHGTGQPAGQVTEGVVGSQPIGMNTGTGHNPAHNTRVEGGTGYGTGGSYS